MKKTHSEIHHASYITRANDALRRTTQPAVAVERPSVTPHRGRRIEKIQRIVLLLDPRELPQITAIERLQRVRLVEIRLVEIRARARRQPVQPRLDDRREHPFPRDHRRRRRAPVPGRVDHGVEEGGAPGGEHGVGAGAVAGDAVRGVEREGDDGPVAVGGDGAVGVREGGAVGGDDGAGDQAAADQVGDLVAAVGEGPVVADEMVEVGRVGRDAEGVGDFGSLEVVGYISELGRDLSFGMRRG